MSSLSSYSCSHLSANAVDTINISTSRSHRIWGSFKHFPCSRLALPEGYRQWRGNCISAEGVEWWLFPHRLHFTQNEKESGSHQVASTLDRADNIFIGDLWLPLSSHQSVFQTSDSRAKSELKLNQSYNCFHTRAPYHVSVWIWTLNSESKDKYFYLFFYLFIIRD